MTAKASTVSQGIGEVSRRWNINCWYDKSDAFVGEKNKHAGAGASEGTEDESSVVIKRGQLYISTRNGFGWHSWRKRWFVLAGKSLIFFKSNPRTEGARGDLNLILGGIFLKDLGRVLIREDKKQLTIVYPDGTTFTLKAETMEDLYAWRTALEHALSTPMFPKRRADQYPT